MDLSALERVYPTSSTPTKWKLAYNVTASISHVNLTQ